ncbi:MAG: sulfurtransferase TusA family protein [Clostridiales bacterium]|jgi:TusA-related sulfurtransferase|nr:sulfurtransferase TusA family protein [Clostridiales bacterium]
MKYDEFLDITAYTCPVTFAKVKVTLDGLDDKKTLLIKLNAGRPLMSIPGSLEEEGHEVVKTTDNGDGTHNLYVVKNGLNG